MSETRSRTARYLGGALVLTALVAAPLAYAGAQGWKGHGGGHGCHGDRPESAAELREHMSRPAEHLLDRADATDDQRARVEGALDTLAPKLWELHDRHDALGEDLHALLAADTVDRAALEALRKDGLAFADEASGYVVDAVYTIASTLSAEQRRDLLDDMPEWHR